MERETLSRGRLGGLGSVTGSTGGSITLGRVLAGLGSSLPFVRGAFLPVSFLEGSFFVVFLGGVLGLEVGFWAGIANEAVRDNPRKRADRKDMPKVR